jgi:hypothetical protein
MDFEYAGYNRYLLKYRETILCPSEIIFVDSLIDGVEITFANGRVVKLPGTVDELWEALRQLSA